MPAYTFVCPTCGKTVSRYRSPDQSPPQHCSRECYKNDPSSICRKNAAKNGFEPGHTTWNKGRSVTLSCQVCRKAFSVPQCRKDTAKYCSRECQHEAKRRITGPDHPLWTRKKCACEWCGKQAWVKRAKLEEFRFCSRQCQGAWMAKQMADQNGPTSIELALMGELDRRHIPYQAQHKIAHWLIDITLPQYRIAIEADGDYWHSSQEQQEKDANKNHWLEAHGWSIFRFSGTEIRKSASQCIAQVLQCITPKQEEGRSDSSRYSQAQLPGFHLTGAT